MIPKKGRKIWIRYKLKMAKIPVLISLLLQLLRTLVEVSGQSPCPQYFMYITDPSTNEVMGQIQIPFPPRNVKLELRVVLSIAIALPTKYVGRLELAQSKKDSIQAIQQGRPLLYNIHFPLRRPIPILTGIWFNNQLYCMGPSPIGLIVTFIVLEHTLYPPQVVSPSQSFHPNTSTPQNSVDFFLPEASTARPGFTISLFPTRRPNRPFTGSKKRPVTQRPTTKSTSETFGLSDKIDSKQLLPNPNRDNNDDCGRSTHIKNVNLLISKGVKTYRGQWPWLVALFLVKLQLEFQCAGSVLTNRHVITAAHCFKVNQTNVNISPNVMLVSLGRYQLRTWREAGSVNREIASYELHPDYTRQDTADSDLAILVLKTPVEFSPTIKPICLWSGPISLQNVVQKSGYVVGWGRDEYGKPHLAEPRMAKMPIVSQEECLWSDPRFVSFTSNRTFCAGLRDGSGPCNGDSGSGLILYNATTGRYQLRGIVSLSLFDQNEMICDFTQYVVFVDIAKYIHWIKQQISTT